MVFAHVIGRGYEYRLKEWFIAHGWKAERNPLSGASDQIEQELGKHDVRAWRDDLNIFLQIECKKTMIKKKNKAGEDDDTIVVQKEWLDKIDFENDEFLVFSFNRCQQHFAYMTQEAADRVIGPLNLNKSVVFEARGDKGYGFKREWLEGKSDFIFVSKFMDKTWYAMDLEIYINARERFKIPTKATSFDERLKIINTKETLKVLFDEESKGWGTKEYRLYYSKLERVESGKDNAYSPSFIKDSQFWLDEGKKFDWNENTVNQILEKIQSWTDKNLEEDKEGNLVWENNSEAESLRKEIKKYWGWTKTMIIKVSNKSLKQPMEINIDDETWEDISAIENKDELNARLLNIAMKQVSQHGYQIGFCSIHKREVTLNECMSCGIQKGWAKGVDNLVKWEACKKEHINYQVGPVRVLANKIKDKSIEGKMNSQSKAEERRDSQTFGETAINSPSDRYFDKQQEKVMRPILDKENNL